VDLKKKRAGYPSVMHFVSLLASGPDEIFNLFADFIQRTYADGALQFNVDEVCYRVFSWK
jgi:hypothetical protein